MIADYEAGAGLLASSVSGMTAAEIRQRPITGKWSTLEVVCHVSDTEQFFADRMKRTLAMERPLLISADGWRYPDATRYHERELDEELLLIRLTRRQMARILRSLPESAWDRSAVHTEMGLITLRDLLIHAVAHLKHHVAFIEAKRRALDSSFQTAGPSSHAIARRGEFLISTDPALLDVAMIHDFLANRSYWALGRQLDIVRRSIDNSLCFGLYEDKRQIGFARMVTDRATFAWLCDVFVLEDYRGRGLSKWLMESVMNHRDLQGLRRMLLGTRDAHGLYTRYGFTSVAEPHRFMEVFRPNVYTGEPGA